MKSVSVPSSSEAGHIKTVRLDARLVRQEIWPALDDDVLAAHRDAQASEERAQLDRALHHLESDGVADAQPEPTSWLSMPESERAQIRPARRRTPAGLLVLVRGDGSAAPVPSGEGEAA